MVKKEISNSINPRSKESTKSRKDTVIGNETTLFGKLYQVARIDYCINYYIN